MDNAVALITPVPEAIAPVMSKTVLLPIPGTVTVRMEEAMQRAPKRL
jgi:hypothetical protein